MASEEVRASDLISGLRYYWAAGEENLLVGLNRGTG